jgi:hypothetical protein
MTIQEMIQRMNALGYSYHVFQYYGPDEMEYGHSKSFHSLEYARKYAAKVKGNVYNAGAEIVIHEYDGQHEA